MQKIRRMPVPVAVLVMALLVLAGVALGNNNALGAAQGETDTVFAEMMDMSKERAQKASNLLVLMNRNLSDHATTAALDDAIETLKNAKKPAQVAEANEALTFAAEAANTVLQAEEAVGWSDKKLATGVIDDITSTDKQIARKATVYNNAIAEVQAVYSQLPMAWLLGGLPEAYK